MVDIYNISLNKSPKEDEPNEMKFVIKMTKEEYLQYMQAKNPKIK